MPMLDSHPNYFRDSKKERARQSARLNAFELAERAQLICFAEALAAAFDSANLSARCGFSEGERSRIRAALVSVNEHLIWAK